MANLPFTQLLVAVLMLLLVWLPRKSIIRFFVKEQKITVLGDLLFASLMIFLPSFLLYNFYNGSLLVNVLIFGGIYELYGFLLYKIEKVDGIGALSYFRKRIANV